MGRKLWAGLGWVWTLLNLVIQAGSVATHADSRGAAILAFLGVLGALVWFAVWGAVRLFHGKLEPSPVWVRWAPAGMLLMVLASVIAYLHSGGMC